ncbi:ER-derived vesicles protein 41 [Termitomyces sp. J132]|nr:ER-derived vesicles protein 41 [Termitomyces sp. J132]
MSSEDSDTSILDKLDSVVPAPLAQFDAFPKIPSTYKSRSESRGFMTIFVALLALLLMLNDIAEYIWGWPDTEFSVDNNKQSYMGINIDIVIGMPCQYLNVDLRDAVGDRLMLTGTVRRDGAVFDTNQAYKFTSHSKALSVQEAVSQSKKSRGFFAWLRRAKTGFQPTYTHESSGDACRVWGTLIVKRVTGDYFLFWSFNCSMTHFLRANLHITTLGHGYASYEHVDHSKMNLSHIIKEFSFGPHFPDIVQPLDYSYEVTHDPFIAYQYFLHVVPTTYIAPRSRPLNTNQYSVTHYTRVMQHNHGTPGIFFKFDLDPLSITIHQRTPSLIQLIIRCVGVIGGIFVCMGYAIRITTRAVEVVSGADAAPGIVAAEATGVKVGLRAKWGGSELRARGKMVRQGTGWVLEGAGDTLLHSRSPSYANASYTGTPTLNGFPSPASASGPPPSTSASPAFNVSPTPSNIPIPPTPQSGAFQSQNSSMFGPGPGQAPANGMRPAATWTPAPGSRHTHTRTPSVAVSASAPIVSGNVPSTPGYAAFPPTPGFSANGNGGGNGPTPVAPPPKRMGGGPKKDD